APHGWDCAEAHRVCAGAVALQPDRRFDYGEERMLAAGMLDGFVVIVVHIENDDTIRIISMRKGTKNEANFYFENIGSD
ncbi:MAG: BrnT family toxin, partial [Usitatibacteraceae bacterium]